MCPEGGTDFYRGEKGPWFSDGSFYPCDSAKLCIHTQRSAAALKGLWESGFWLWKSRGPGLFNVWKFASGFRETALEASSLEPMAVGQPDDFDDLDSNPGLPSLPVQQAGPASPTHGESQLLNILAECKRTSVFWQSCLGSSARVLLKD